MILKDSQKKLWDKKWALDRSRAGLEEPDDGATMHKDGESHYCSLANPLIMEPDDDDEDDEDEAAAGFFCDAKLLCDADCVIGVAFLNGSSLLAVGSCCIDCDGCNPLDVAELDATA